MLDGGRLIWLVGVANSEESGGIALELGRSWRQGFVAHWRCRLTLASFAGNGTVASNSERNSVWLLAAIDDGDCGPLSSLEAPPWSFLNINTQIRFFGSKL
jgi:hypothetical protein